MKWLAPLLLVACSSPAASELPPAPKPKPRPAAPAPAPAEARADHHGKLDPGRPFELWFGRGNDEDGLEIVYVPEIGEVEIDRDRAGEHGIVAPQRGTVALDEKQWDDLRDLVRHLKINQLQDAYVAEARNEGTQWILRIRQAAFERTIYCSNLFPHELRRFATSLDQLLLAADLADNAFEEAPPDAEQREQTLWASVGR